MVAWVVFEIDIEVMKIPPGSTHDDYIFNHGIPLNRTM
jgi:hypothetical protein